MKVTNLDTKLKSFVALFPDVVSVIAYGSGVARQDNEEKNDKKQIDLIVVVEDIKAFFRENLKKNKDMYPAIPKTYFRLSSAKRLKKAAGICYTSGIEYNGDTFKVGVVEKSTLLEDLEKWKTFYLAGRFQKERRIVVEDKEVEEFNEMNKTNAVVTALLLLNKEHPTVNDLYEQICSLSYIGDTRTKFKAEDPNKVKNIAVGSKDYFDKIYKARCDAYSVDKNENLTIHYDKLFGYIPSLPNGIRSEIEGTVQKTNPEQKIAYSEDNLGEIRGAIVKFLTRVNKKASLGQTVKGIFTTGPTKAVGYALRKLKKGKNKKQQ